MQIVRDIAVLSDTIAEPITLAEAKNYLRVDYSEDDTLIEALITSARVRLEQYAGVAMTQRNLQVVAFMSEFIELPYVPIGNLLSVEYWNNTEWLELEEGDYNVIGTNTMKVYAVAYGEGEYRFTYTCGYCDPTPTMRTACFKMLADLYEYRESSVESSRPSANLTTAYELMKPYKRINYIL
jgi:Phage gp6-like head-tail connector protein